MRALPALLLLLVAAGASAGCAVRVGGPGGVVHTIGFAWTTTAPPKTATPEDDPSASKHVSFALGPTTDEEARLQRTRVAGLWADLTPRQRGVGVGWTDTLLVLPVENGFTEVDYDSSDWTATRMQNETPPR